MPSPQRLSRRRERGSSATRNARLPALPPSLVAFPAWLPSLRCFLPSLAGEGARRADGGTLAAVGSKQQFLRRQKRQERSKRPLSLIETSTQPARQRRKHPLPPTPLPQAGEGLKRDARYSPSRVAALPGRLPSCFLPSPAGEGARRAEGGTLAAAGSRQQLFRRQKRQERSRRPPSLIETSTQSARQLRKHPLTPAPLPQAGEGLKRDARYSPSRVAALTGRLPSCFLPSLAGEGARRADGDTLAAAGSRQHLFRRQKRQDSRLPPAEEGEALPSPATHATRIGNRCRNRAPTNSHSSFPAAVLQGFLAAAGSLTIFSKSFCRSANSGSIFCWMAPIRFWVSAGVLSSRLWPAELS